MKNDLVTVRHADGEQEHSLCGMAFDAFASGDAEEEIIFAKSGETVTCQNCRDHLDFVRKFYRRYKYVMPNNQLCTPSPIPTSSS